MKTRFLVIFTGHRSWQKDGLLQSAIHLLLQLRGIDTTASLRGVILSNFPAHNKVDIVDVEVDLRHSYCANSKDDVDLWAALNWGSRAHVTLSCHRTGFHCPSETLAPIPYATQQPVSVTSLAVRLMSNAPGDLAPDGPTDSRLSRTLPSAFSTAFALLGYSRGVWGAQKFSGSAATKGELYIETRDWDTVERCLRMVSLVRCISARSTLC